MENTHKVVRDMRVVYGSNILNMSSVSNTDMPFTAKLYITDKIETLFAFDINFIEFLFYFNVICRIEILFAFNVNASFVNRITPPTFKLVKNSIEYWENQVSVYINMSAIVKLYNNLLSYIIFSNIDNQYALLKHMDISRFHYEKTYLARKNRLTLCMSEMQGENCWYEKNILFVATGKKNPLRPMAVKYFGLVQWASQNGLTLMI